MGQTPPARDLPSGQHSRCWRGGCYDEWLRASWAQHGATSAIPDASYGAGELWASTTGADVGRPSSSGS